VKIQLMFAQKKVFLNKQGLKPTIVGKAMALAISTVGSLNKSCGSKVPYIGFIWFLRERNCKVMTKIRTHIFVNMFVLFGKIIYGADRHNSLGKVAMWHYMEPIDIIP
jgi:hypothetical protein